MDVITVTTVEHLERAKEMQLVELHLTLDRDSDIAGLARVLPTFETHLCRIIVRGPQESIDNYWMRPEVLLLFVAIGNLESVVHLDLEGLSDIQDSATAFPLVLLAPLLKHMRSRLTGLALQGTIFVGSEATMKDFIHTIGNLGSLTEFAVLAIRLSAFSNHADELSGLEVAIQNDALYDYPVSKLISALSKLPMLRSVALCCLAPWEEDEYGMPSRPQPQHIVPCLLASKSIQELSISNLDIDDASEEMKAIAQALSARDCPLTMLRMEIVDSEEPERASTAALMSIANSLQTNARLQEFRLKFEGDSPPLDHFLVQTASAIASNTATSLRIFKIKSQYIYGADVEVAFAKMLESNYSLQTVEFCMVSTEGEKFVHETSKRNEIDLYLRLNRQGRKDLMTKSGTLFRAKWVDALALCSHDFSALYYYIRTYPFLCDVAPKLSSSPPSKKRGRLEIAGAVVDIDPTLETRRPRLCDKDLQIQTLTSAQSNLEKKVQSLQNENARLLAKLSNE